MEKEILFQKRSKIVRQIILILSINLTVSLALLVGGATLYTATSLFLFFCLGEFALFLFNTFLNTTS